MRRLATVCLFVVACLASLAAKAQVTVISSQVIDQSGQPLPFAQVRVCSVTSTGVPCTPTAAIYQDYALTVPAPNPTTSDQYGNFTVYAGTLPAPNLYTVQYSPASGVTWSHVYNGPFLSATGGTVTGYITALGYNGVPEADQCSGVDAFAKINTCAGMLPNGGVEDALGFGSVPQTVTTNLTALANPARPITLELNPATVFTLNNSFSPGAINSSITSGVSGATGACIVPIANGSAIVSPGFNQLFGNLRLGPTAATYDVVCNANQDGTEQSFIIDGLGIVGNQSATMSGSLLHIVQTFSGTRVENVNTFHPFGNAVTVSGGGPYVFLNDNFADAYNGPAQYAGAVLTLNCTTNATFQGGSIQDNGLFNPILVTNNCLTSDARTPTKGFGYQNFGIHIYDSYLETQPATIGSFPGAATNVDPIQLLDTTNTLIDNTRVSGASGAGQMHLVDIQSAGSFGQLRGPVELKDIWGGTASFVSSGKSLIHNTTGVFVSPALADVFPTQNGGDTWMVGEYRWEGSGFPQGSSIDYEDFKDFSSVQSTNVNSVVNASRQAGADIGAKINAALAQCALQCTVYVPAGNYSFSTSIDLTLAVVNKFKLELDAGAILTYTGTGDAITTTLNPFASFANLWIEGGQLVGSGSGNGIHVIASSFVNISHTVISGFANGIFLDGPNTVNIDHNFIQSNQVGILMNVTFCTLNVCGPTPSSGSAFTTNKINIVQNSIVQNSNWAIFDENNQPSNTGSLGNQIQGNDLENNGSAGSAFGAINILRATGLLIEQNYFEGSPRQIVLGNTPLGSPFYFAVQSPNIVNNYFTELIGTPYSIELTNTTYARIEGNATDDVTMNSSNCFVNVTTTGTTAENHTLFGQNDVILSGGGNLFCAAGAVIQNFAGSGSYQMFNQNFTPRLVFANFPITNAASDSVPAQFVATTSVCYATAPSGASALTSAALLSQTYFVAGTGAATFFHPTGNSGLLFNIWCSGPQNL